MNKIILITGSSSGIGKATALRFAKEGNKIIVNFLENQKGAEEVVNEIKQLGSEAIAIQADVSTESEAKKLVENIINKFGTIDILVNNVGGYIDGDEWNGPTQIWEETLKKNLISTMNVSKFIIPIFQKEKKGIIINVSSRYSLSGKDDAISYAASKAAIINITQAYAKMLAPFGRANAISPGAVETGYWLRAPKEEIEQNLKNIPMKSFVKLEEVAELIYYLTSDNARMIIGQNIVMDGGSTLI